MQNEEKLKAGRKRAKLKIRKLNEFEKSTNEKPANVSQPTQCNPNPRINKLLSAWDAKQKSKLVLKKKYLYAGEWGEKKGRRTTKKCINNNARVAVNK